MYTKTEQYAQSAAIKLSPITNVLLYKLREVLDKEEAIKAETMSVGIILIASMIGAASNKITPVSLSDNLAALNRGMAIALEAMAADPNRPYEKAGIKLPSSVSFDVRIVEHD